MHLISINTPVLIVHHKLISEKWESPTLQETVLLNSFNVKQNVLNSLGLQWKHTKLHIAIRNHKMTIGNNLLGKIIGELFLLILASKTGEYLGRYLHWNLGDSRRLLNLDAPPPPLPSLYPPRMTFLQPYRLLPAVASKIYFKKPDVVLKSNKNDLWH